MHVFVSVVDRIREVLAIFPASSKMVNASALLALCASAAPAAGNIMLYQPGVSIAPSPLPPPGPSSHGEEIIRQFVGLSLATEWSLVDKVQFQGETFEPEGMVRLGNDRYFVSAYERPIPALRYNTAPDGADAQGAGFAHMMVFDGKGGQVADATITEEGSSEYHNGGIDYDGTYIWATLGQNRPDSTATLVRMRPDTLRPEPILRIQDHMGAAIHDLSSGNILTLNWGARSASVWNLRYKAEVPPAFTAPRAVIKNPSHYTDYQDCKFLGHSQHYAFRPVMLCSGITRLYGTVIGGVALVDMESMAPLYEVPLTMVSDTGMLVTKNPMDVALVDGKMRLFFLPDERNSTLYVYEPI
ncbi:hypothetical protein BT67DRAFT_124185 [Trichocladium antarcticum]|uniref:Uncharacterized protein n=1 Tax=Trichocladium antarcticum TaxID=1450529 RepID=A0AAN6ZG31_9PEZI|nr:hypothetical protein BT67DRAFT_124185 [Trichocladium antarcticum]